jgi:M6 family metalloprotease-like protein
MSTLKVKGLVVFFSLALFSLAVQAQGQSGRVEISGEAAVEIADYFEEDRSELYYFIIDKQSRSRTRVFFPGLPDAAFRSGATVRIHGRSRGNGRGVDVDSIEILEPAPRPGSDPGIEAPVAPNQTRKVLTLIVNFLDAVVDTGTQNAVTPTIVSNQMFHDTQNIQHFYETASLGTLAMPSDPNAIGKEAIFGPYTIPYYYLAANGGTCIADTWADAALAAWEADTAGNPMRETRSDYTNWSIIVPNYWDYSGRACTWGGLAGVGCTQCWAFSADPASILFGVVIHELGHNFGFGHARYDTNNDGDSDCEYCDASDLMGGNRSWMKFNAPHFDYLGWWDPVTYEIDTITPTSTQQAFNLIPVDEEGGPWPGLRAVKTARTGSSNYYFSWRQQTGHYNNVNTPYTTGVNVHWSGLSDYASNFYRFLEAGQVFSDAGQDLLVRAEGATEVDDGLGNTTEVFTIQVCNSTCSTLWPPLSLSAAGPFPDTIKLTWEDYTYNEDGWRIEYSTDGSSWSELTTVAADSTFYNHLGLAGGTTLYYRVQAYRIAAETSEWSETVSATTPFSIGGTVSGLEGSGLVLQNNAGDDLAIDSDGSFTFATPQSDGSDYAVTVMTQPSDPSQTCIVSDGSGTVDGADVITVAVTCGNGFIFNNGFEDL